MLYCYVSLFEFEKRVKAFKLWQSKSAHRGKSLLLIFGEMTTCCTGRNDHCYLCWCNVGNDIWTPYALLLSITIYDNPRPSVPLPGDLYLLLHLWYSFDLWV